MLTLTELWKDGSWEGKAAMLEPVSVSVCVYVPKYLSDAVSPLLLLGDLPVSPRRSPTSIVLPEVALPIQWLKLSLPTHACALLNGRFCQLIMPFQNVLYSCHGERRRLVLH